MTNKVSEVSGVIKEAAGKVKHVASKVSKVVEEIPKVAKAVSEAVSGPKAKDADEGLTKAVVAGAKIAESVGKIKEEVAPSKLHQKTPATKKEITWIQPVTYKK